MVMARSVPRNQSQGDVVVRDVKSLVLVVRALRSIVTEGAINQVTAMNPIVAAVEVRKEADIVIMAVLMLITVDLTMEEEEAEGMAAIVIDSEEETIGEVTRAPLDEEEPDPVVSAVRAVEVVMEAIAATVAGRLAGAIVVPQAGAGVVVLMMIPADQGA